MVIKASGGKITRDQAERTWAKTIHPYGKKLGLLTGYVKPQEGTSKRTASGDIELQRHWHDLCDKTFCTVREAAMAILGDKKLVEELMPYLVVNLDEECLHALGKNSRIVGSRSKKKHDNQNGSSRFHYFSVRFFFVLSWPAQISRQSPGGLFALWAVLSI